LADFVELIKIIDLNSESAKIAGQEKAFLVKYEDIYDIALLAANQTIRDRFNIPKEKYTAISNLIKKCLDSHLIRKFDPDNKAPRYGKYAPAWA